MPDPAEEPLWPIGELKIAGKTRSPPVKSDAELKTDKVNPNDWPTSPPGEPGHYWLKDPNHELEFVAQLTFGCGNRIWRSIAWEGVGVEEEMVRRGIKFGPRIYSPRRLNDMAAELKAFKQAEKGLSDAYIRLRQKLNAFETPHAPTPEQIWKHTEDKLDDLKAENERLANILVSLEDLGELMLGSEILSQIKAISQGKSIRKLPTPSRDEGKEEKLWFVDTVFQMDEEGYSSPDTRFYVRGEAGYFLDSTKAQDLCNRLNASAARFLEGSR